MDRKRKFSWFGNNLIDIAEIEGLSYELDSIKISLYAHSKSGTKYFIGFRDNEDQANLEVENFMRGTLGGEYI